jgi:large subunit ribosomal protein L3
MGNVRRTIQNQTVFAVDQEKGLLLIRGAIPGPKNSVVLVRSSVKGA